MFFFFFVLNVLVTEQKKKRERESERERHRHWEMRVKLRSCLCNCHCQQSVTQMKVRLVRSDSLHVAGSERDWSLLLLSGILKVYETSGLGPRGGVFATLERLKRERGCSGSVK